MAGWGERERQRKRIHRHIGIILPLFVERQGARTHKHSWLDSVITKQRLRESLPLSPSFLPASPRSSWP